MSEQAEREVNEVLDEMLGKGLRPRSMIALVDVQKAMVLAWDRGYSAAIEAVVDPTTGEKKWLNPT